MEKRTLGRTGLNVAIVGFGALPMGGFYGPVDDAVSMKALHAAIDAGINFIDTSDAYGAGHSERAVGAFLKERADRESTTTSVDRQPVGLGDKGPFGICDEAGKVVRLVEYRAT